MPDTSDDIQRKIDHLEGQRAILGDAIVNEMIAKLRAEIPSAGETHGTATTHDNYGQNIGVNLGVAIFGRDPREDERRRLIWYLDWLCGDLDQLRLHMLEKKLDQRGAGMSLSSVYVMLATQNRYGVTVEDWQDELVLSSYIDNGVNFSDLQNLLMSGNERFVSLLKPQHQPDWGLPSDVITWGALSPADQIDSVPEQSSGLVCTLARALLATEAVQQHQHLVLLGNPGSGKSTFLRHLALLLARRGLGQVGDDDAALPRELTTKLPIILPLQRLSRHLAAEGVSDATVVAALKAELARSSVTQVDDLLSESLHRGAALLLLDGLDEVPLEGVPGERVDRQTVVQAVRDFALHYSRVTVVLTCRVRAFSDDLRAHLGWPVETLAPFTLGQMRHFVPAWYGELVRTNQLSAEQATYYEQTLIDALVQRPRLKEMAETPLLLTMMALVLYNKNELPRDRPRLYEDILYLLNISGNPPCRKPVLRLYSAYDEVIA